MKITEFQGSEIVETPAQPGIYAWYYRPQASGNNVSDILGQLIKTPFRVKTEIAMRYRVIWTAESEVDVLHGAERQPADRVVANIVTDGGELIKSLLQHAMVPYFATPLYIGISRNLSRRVKEHYDSLTQLWETDAPVNSYLEQNPHAAVEDVLDQFNLNHSFPLNARVKGIAPNDLVVCVLPVEAPEKLRDLEQILQILADPICGRR